MQVSPRHARTLGAFLLAAAAFAAPALRGGRQQFAFDVPPLELPDRPAKVNR